MSLASVNFNQSTNGIGAALPGQDFISGLVAYVSSLPAGLTTANRIKEIFSVADAEALGIVGDSSDETKATGTYLITTKGATGDVIKVQVVEYGATVTLCTYAAVAGDSTIALLGASIAAAINANSAANGYTASFATATLTINARPGLGIFLNSGTPIVVTITGTIAGTITQFSGGVASVLTPIHYHIAEYFRINPSGDLFIGLFSVPGGSYNFAEVQTLQNFANGNCRQIGVYYKATFTSADVLAAQAQAVILDQASTPAVIGLCGDLSTNTLAALTDLSGSQSEMVFVNIGQDGANVGYQIFKALGKSVGSIGAQLGTISLASVGQNIAEVGAFQVATAELDVLAFTTGELYSAQSKTLLGNVENKKYTFLLKQQPGYSGSFWNFSYTCTLSGDYPTIERVRTIQKSKRVSRIALIPKLNAQIVLNADGTLTAQSIEAYKSLIETQIDTIVANGDLSNYKVVVNPRQNILQTNIITITLQLLPVGISKFIVVNIGFVASLS